MQNAFSQNSLDDALKKMPKAQQTNINESMTSAGRLDKMLGSNSNLMKRAQTQGKQQAQQRGLLNSSMAAGAAQGAMIDRAQPFAMQDSNNLIQNAQRNTDAQNKRGLLQAGLIGDSYKSNQNYAQQMGLNEQAYGFESKMAEQQQGYQQENMQLGSDLSREEAEQQQGYQQENMQLGSDLSREEAQQQQEFKQGNMRLGSSLEEQQMQLSQALEQGNMQLANSLQKSINEQQAGLQASRDERLSGYDQDMQRLNQELQEAQSQNDFGRTQQLESQRAEIQSARDETLFSYDMQNVDKQAEVQAARDRRLNELDAESARLNADLQEAQAANDFQRTEQLTERQAEIQESRDKLTFAQNMESMAEEYGFQSELATQEAQQTMEKLFATSTANSWGVTANNLTDIVGQYSQQIERIQMNPDIEEADKEELIEQTLGMRDTDIAFQQQMYESLSNMMTDTGAFPDGLGFSESAYLENNPDVAQAVQSGKIPSGQFHYSNYGRAEGRAPNA